MTPEAQNSLLKSLEEPSAIIFLFLLPVNRNQFCRRSGRAVRVIIFQPLGILDTEAIISGEAEFAKVAVTEAVRASGGSPGMALYLLNNSEIQKERTHYLRSCTAL